MVSDFQSFRLHDLDTGAESEFSLADLPKNVQRFAFIAGYKTREFKDEDPVNIY